MKLHKLGAKMLSLLLVFALFIGMVPASAVNLGGASKFNSALVQELVEYCGSEAAALAMLEKLYETGVVDETGMPKLADSFNVNGTTMTTAQLQAAAKTHDGADPLTLDGKSMTWGDLQELLGYYDIMAALVKIKNGESIELTAEHQTNIASLVSAMRKGGLTATFPNNLDVSMLAVGDTVEGTINVTKNADGKWYYEAPGVGEAGYEAAHQFILVNQAAVTPDSEGASTGTAPTWAVESEAILTDVVVTMALDKTSIAKTGGKITVTATLNKAQTADVMFAYRTVAGSFDPGNNGGSCTIPAGSTSKTFEITAAASSSEWQGKRTFLIQAYSLINAKFSDGKTAWEQSVTVADSTVYGGMEIKVTENLPFSATNDTEMDGVVFIPFGQKSGYDSRPSFEIIRPAAGQWNEAVKNMDMALTYICTTKIKITSHTLTAVTTEQGSGVRWYPLADMEALDERAKVMTIDQSSADYISTLHMVQEKDKKRAVGLNYSGDYYYIGLNVYNCKGTINGILSITMKGILEQTEVSQINIPSGNFYPGQNVPITVTFKNPMLLNDQITLTANGKALTPTETGTKSTVATFLYPVQPLDSGTVSLSTITFGAEAKSAYWQTDADGYIKLNKDLNGKGSTNEGCKLQTPSKLDSFKDDDGNTTAVIAIDDADPTKQTQIVQMEINDKAEGNNLPYIAWIAQNTEPVSPAVKVLDKTGAELECGFYVKSMYLSNDGGTTRFPLYVVTAEENVTIGGVAYSEKPVSLVANIKPEMNLTSNMRQDTLTVHMDPAIGSTTDYIKDATKSAPVIIEDGFSGTTLVKGAIFLEEDQNDVTITYNDAWTATHMDYRIQDQNEILKLAYTVNDRPDTAERPYAKEDFTFAADDWFEWESSDTTIANISNEKDHKGEITPTGKEGDVTFTLHVKNGDVEGFDYELTSVELKVKMGLTPFIIVPATSADRTVLTGSALDVYFTSNLTARNDWDAVSVEKKAAWDALSPEDKEKPENKLPTSGTATEFTLAVYALGEGGTFIAEGTGANKDAILATTPVYTTTASSTVEDTVGSINIPAETLMALSKTGFHSYVVRVSAPYLAEADKTFESFALIRVKSRPAEVKLAPLDNYFVLNGAVPSLNWEMKYLNSTASTATGYYVIKGPGQTGAPVDLDFSAGTSGTIPTNTLASGDTLKSTYTISVYARNSESEPWSVDSAVLYVYNAGVLEILVSDVARGTLGGTTTGVGENQNGKELDITNIPYINGLTKNTAGEDNNNDLSIVLGDGVTMEQLRSDLNLQKVVSINYGEQVWGMLSDQIKWNAANPKNEDGKTIKTATVDYYQGGFYSDIESYDYSSYLPGTDFLVVGHKDGKSTVSATHARTGQSMSVDFDVQTLKDQLYLFAFRPAATVTVSYTNGAGEKRQVMTDENGQLALYEPEGIASDVYLGTSIDGVPHLGTIFHKSLLSGEQDAAAMQLYPCNNLALLPTGKIQIQLCTPNGGLYANQEVVVRGGVYKNGLYCEDAQFSTVEGSSADVNGREDMVLRTDYKGRINLGTDSTQYKLDSSDGEEVYDFTKDIIDFVLEIRFPEGAGYEPTLTRFNIVDKGTLQTVLRPAKDEKSPALTNQVLQQYYPENPDGTGASIPRGAVQDVLYSTENVGPSRTVNKGILVSNTLFPGVGIELNEETGFAELSKDTKIESVLYDDNGTAFPMQLSTSVGTQLMDLSLLDWDNVETAVYVYPFSSMPIVRNRIEMSAETFGRKGELHENETGIPVYDYDYLGYNDPTKLHFAYTIDGVMVKTQNCTFAVNNMLDQPEIVNDPETKKNVQALDKRINDEMNMGKILSEVKVDNVLAMVFSKLMQVGADQLDIPINLMIIPTEDPMNFDILALVGDTDEMDAYMEQTMAGSFGTEVQAGYEMTQSALAKAQEFDEKRKEIEGLMSGNGSVSSVKHERTMYACFVANATLDPINDRWGFDFIGGTATYKSTTMTSVKHNFRIAGYPITISYDADTNAEGTITMRTNLKDNVDLLLDVLMGVSIEAFAGIGFDYSVIALKLGIFGSVGFDLEFLSWMGTEGNDAFKHGELIDIRGEIGIQAVAKLLFIDFTVTFCSTSFGWRREWNDYTELKKKSGESILPFAMQPWNGTTLEGQEYTAVPQGDGTVLIAITDSTIESRSYLTNGNERVWMGGNEAALFSLDTPNMVDKLQTNAYPASNPVYTDDGQLLLYIDDAGSKDVQDTIASFAALDGTSYAQKGQLDDPAIRYGDSGITASGVDGKYFAAWIRQSEEIRKEAGDKTGDGDLSMMINGTEIMVGSYNPAAAGTEEDPMWTVEALTSNKSGDMAPNVASNANGNAIVAWRSVDSSSSEHAADFDTTDNIMFRVFDGTSWKDAKVAYNGSKGNVTALDAAMLSDGTALITYTVKTEKAVGEGDKADNKDNSTETFYTMISPEGAVTETVRATTNSTVDLNAQVAVVKQGTEEQFLLAWYAEQDVAGSGSENKDICLRAIKADGSMDSNLPESVAGVSDLQITASFQLAVAPGATLNEVAISWVQPETVKEGGTINHLKAVKFYDVGGQLRLTPPQEIATLENNIVADHYDAYMDADGAVRAVIQASDYTSCGVDKIGTVDGNEAIKAQLIAAGLKEGTDEYAAKFSELKGKATIDIFASKPEALLLTATGEFAGSYSVGEPYYSLYDLEPGFELPVQFTLTNTGVTKIETATVKLGGETKDFTVNLQPGDTASMMMYYLPEESGVITNPDYEVTASSGTRARENAGTLTLAGENTGTLTLNLPDVGISELKLMREESKERDIQVTLYNNTPIPLEGNADKTVKVGFYSDTACQNELADPVVVDAANYDRIDSGTYFLTQTIDATKLATAQEKLNDAGEIGDKGLTVYTRVWVEKNGVKQEELNTDNNLNYISFKGLLTKRVNPLEMSGSMSKNEDGSYELTYTIQNNSFNQTEKMAFIARILDEDGNVLTSRFFNGLQLNGEEKKTGKETVPVDEVRGVPASVVVEVPEPPFAVGFETRGVVEKTARPEEQVFEVSGGKIVEPDSTTLVAEDLDFAGWYSSQDYVDKYKWNFNDGVYCDVTLFANWVPHAGGHAVTFDAWTNGGAVERSIAGTDASGKLIRELPSAEKSGYSFNGWFTAPEKGEKFAADTVVTENTRVYAQFTPTSSSNKPSIIVDGKKESIGKNEVKNGVTTALIDQAKLGSSIAAASNGSSVVISVTGTTLSGAAQLTVKNIQDMAAKDMKLEVSYKGATYILPADAVDTAAIMANMGADSAATTFVVTITQKKDIKAEGLTIIGTPFTFTVSATNDGKTATVDKFSAPVTRTIELTKEQAAKVATAVVVEQDGKTRHVPTNVRVKDGKHYAVINSLTNSTYALVSYETAFGDLEGKWFAAQAAELGNRMVINGVGKNTFAGENDITRAEFAAILVRALGLPADGKGDFSDVAADAWYAGAVGTANEYGLVKGSGGKFRPQDKITRQEAMVMITRAAELMGWAGESGSEGAFTDADQVAKWAQDSVDFNTANGLIVGVKNQLLPTAEITRAETVTVLLRLLQKAGLVDVRSNVS